MQKNICLFDSIDMEGLYMEEKKDDDQIVFLLKSMKKQYVKDTITKGRFCFNHPAIFSQWEDANAAQYDRWEAHSAFEAKYLVAAPIIGENNGMPIYGKGKKIADKAIIHMQTDIVKYSPICCFRTVKTTEVSFLGDKIEYTLGQTAQKIKKEFGHDSFVLIQVGPFIERLKRIVNSFIAMEVVYCDLINNYPFKVEKKYREIAEQLFRKDKKFEWQKEYRIALQPSQETPVFIELGSLEDIAASGDLDDLAY